MARMSQPNLPPPTTIARLSSAVHASFAMLAACRLDLFTPLQHGPLSAAQLADALGVEPDRLSVLLYVLVAGGLLAVEEGRFANTAEAQEYLVRGRPAYQGDRHGLWSDLWHAELRTAETIRLGRAAARHDYARMSPEELLTFYRGLHANAMATGRLLAQRYDWSACRSVLDVGGGSGGVAIALARACPDLRATVVDLPNVTPLTRQFVAEEGAQERVEVQTANIVHAPPAGQFDAAVLRYLIQVLGAAEAASTIRHTAAALRPGGVIYIAGWILDDSRQTPPQAVMANLTMINLYDGGQVYTEHEHFTWLREAGCGDCERVTLPEGVGIIRARKL